jgi:predicted N-acetyltransferase YhbS
MVDEQMIRAPELQTAQHQLSQFLSGSAVLDEWLTKRALQNQQSGASRTLVICEQDEVIGYYALASGAVATTLATGRFKRNMPDPVPVIVLARLAVSQTHQGKGLGRALFRDAALRVLGAAELIGVRGMLVHAISADAKAFYEALGLQSSAIDPMTLMVTMADLRMACAT